VVQIVFVGREVKEAWVDVKGNPIAFAAGLTTNTVQRLKKLIATPHLLPAVTTAIVAVVCTAAIVLMVNGSARTSDKTLADANEHAPEIVMLDLHTPPEVTNEAGRGSIGRTPLKDGGMGGGNRDPHPPQAGKLPPPSIIPAPIPITPPLNPPSLPVAGIDIDPTQWKDLDAPVYGDPNSKSQIPSSGPGEDGGIGTGKGFQIGPGSGYGTGSGGCGTISKETGKVSCIGSDGRTFKGSEVEQRARILSKPEPQYTEEARKNQLSGTVMLRAVFSSSGEVVQIQALRTLPFGLTEQAIVAARRIKFVPATKGGQPVSVSMHLEYNFNLY
jgi:TonB family protein